MASLCLFDSPDFTKTVGDALPTYLIDPANTNTISVTGSFTNGLGTVCQFPTTKPALLGLAGGNTITPYLVGPNKATTTCGFITPPSNLLGILANGMATYTAVSCPSVAWNQLPTGTYALGFTEPAGPAFTQGQFVIAPATTFSSSVFATVTSSTTLSPAGPSTVTSSGTSFVPLTVSLSAPAASTTTAMAYSSTITSSINSTLSAAGSVVTIMDYTEIDYTTMFSSVALSSTQVITDVSTTTITQTGTSTVVGTPLTITASVSSCPTTPSALLSSSSSSLASTTSSSSSRSLSTSASSSSSIATSTTSSATTEASSTSQGLSTSSSSIIPARSTSTTSSSTITTSTTSSLAITSSLVPATSSNTTSSPAVSVTTTSSSILPTIIPSINLSTSLLPSVVTPSASSLVPTISSAPTISTSSSVPTIIPSITLSSAEQVPSTMACPASNGTVITSNGKQFQIECFLDRQSAQIAVKAANTFTDCTNACAITSGCWAVSYSNKFCYMKGALSLPIYNSNVWGARVMADAPVSTFTSASVSSKLSVPSTAPTVSSTVSASAAVALSALACPNSGSTTYNTTSGSQFLIECFIDHQGGNLAMSYQPSLEACIAYCDALTGCVDVSWIPGRPGPCYAKSLLGTGTASSSVWGAKKIAAGRPAVSSSATSSSPSTTSAAATGLASLCPKGITNTTLSCPSSNSFCYTTPENDIYHVECSTDRIGGDLLLAWAGSLETCLIICSDTPGCVDVSFVPALTAAITPGKIQYGCYLKSSIQAAVTNSKVMGAVLVSRGNSSLPIPKFPAAFTLAKRATRVGAPDYTYPVYPTTTITAGTSVILQTITPPAAAAVTTSEFATVYTTHTVTPAASGVATTTITTAATLYTTKYVAGVAQASTVTVGAATVSTVTAVLTQNVVVLQTSVVIQTAVVSVVMMQTRSADVVTVTTTTCFALA